MIVIGFCISWILFDYVRNLNIVLDLFGINLVGVVVICIVNVIFWFIVLNLRIVGFIVIVIFCGVIMVDVYVDFVGLIFVIVFVSVVDSILEIDWLNIIDNVG